MRDVKGKDIITLCEKKTDKERSSPINAALKSKIKKYVADKEDYVNLMRLFDVENMLHKTGQNYEHLIKAANEIEKPIDFDF